MVENNREVWRERLPEKQAGCFKKTNRERVNRKKSKRQLTWGGGVGGESRLKKRRWMGPKREITEKKRIVEAIFFYLSWIQSKK